MRGIQHSSADGKDAASDIINCREAGHGEAKDKLQRDRGHDHDKVRHKRREPDVRVVEFYGRRRRPSHKRRQDPTERRKYCQDCSERVIRTVPYVDHLCEKMSWWLAGKIGFLKEAVKRSK